MTIMEFRRLKIIGLFCNKEPDLSLVIAENHLPLQDWICSHLKPEFKYATGDSIIQASFDISESGVLNDTDDEGRLGPFMND